MYYIFSFVGILSLFTFVINKLRGRLFGITFEIIYRIREIFKQSKKVVNYIIIHNNFI